ncbi:MAG: methylglyoxal synthase [Cellvibrionaceae bacterium]|jgi:methylglyoxal synthase
MKYIVRTMKAKKNIALVAHDNQKKKLLNWSKKNIQTLEKHSLYATGTTGYLLKETLKQDVICLFSGPMGGDQQLGAKVAEGEIDMLIFFWDPLEQQPHDPDIKALLRIAAVWNIPIACNESSADFLLTSTLFNDEFAHEVPDYDDYLDSRVN